MESHQNNIRPLRPWSIVSVGESKVVFERRVYEKSRKSNHKITETLDFSQTDISEHIRQCLITYISLGKISPSHVRLLISEYKMHRSTASDRTTPKTLKEFLSLLSARLPDAFDDPMQGVLTRPFHKGLFEDKSLMDALEQIHTIQNKANKELFMLYFKTYTKCRQTIMDMAFSMAREIPSLTDADIHSGEEFFSWWRRRCNREIRIDLSNNEEIALFLPDLPEQLLSMLTKIIQDITNDYARLAYLLRRPLEDVKEFIRAFVIELNEGMINLPLNQYGKERCPAAKDLETSIKSSAGFPTTSACIKEVSIAGHVLEDAFKRFFSIKYKSFLLPRTQSEIIIAQLGGCPFPDYGFMDMDTACMAEK